MLSVRHDMDAISQSVIIELIKSYLEDNNIRAYRSMHGSMELIITKRINDSVYHPTIRITPTFIYTTPPTRVTDIELDNPNCFAKILELIKTIQQ